MLNDRKASELVSRSLHDGLPDEDQREMQQALAHSQEARSFAQLSNIIQKTVSGIAASSEAGDESVLPGLSAAARERLRESVRVAHGRSVQTLRSGDVHDQGSQSRDVAGKSLAFGAPEDTRRANLRFTLIRKIGEGGLGTVWLARDEALKRTVAIKEMNADAAKSPKLWQRFQREAQITGHLEHPSIVPLYMFGMNAETGHPFCAMRFLGKQTLADAIVEYHGRRSSGHADGMQLHRLLTTFLDVCQAIAYAHSRGVIHRDLKPENVALDRFGQVIVLDWGLAKLISDGELAIQLALSPSADDSSLDQSIAGGVIGTPLYMAPEQAAGELDKVDERTDVYGLGAILFAILSGAAPHEKSNTSTNGAIRVTELLQAIAENETPKPGDFTAHIPKDLEAICMRAMAKERYARHASALDLANDVERWIAGQHEQRQLYDAIRLEGNEIRSNLVACVRDLGTIARFVAILPPIQGLIDVENDGDQEGSATWRERLSTICNGLLRTKPILAAITFSRVDESNIREWVRVERHSADPTSIRTVPKSRLSQGELDWFSSAVIGQKPEEVYCGLVGESDPLAATSAPGLQRLVAGVPIFDSRSEEVVGLVTVEIDFDRLLETEFRTHSNSAGEFLVVNDQGIVVKHQRDCKRSAGKTADECFPNWSLIATAVSACGEYGDSDRALYALRLDLMPRVSSLTIVLAVDTAN